MKRLGIILAVALPVFALAQEAEKEKPAAPAAIEKAATPPKKAIAEPAQKIRAKNGDLLHVAHDGTITYYVDRDIAVTALIQEIYRLRAVEKACKKKD